MAQVAEAVDRFEQWSELEQRLAVALFHMTAVLEEGEQSSQQQAVPCAPAW
ncbi:hypothetical protein [Lamprobacter modestohalophilus]|uniref:hypothetical protein n=1 Tax=Lamprobacter modestohalophilus TaxID=1064514 RepID=UPI00190756E4|nr:hypothetical protein [Lamprobacter modestohalophilus]